LKGNVVEQLYRRIDDLDEKIKGITLPYLSWKTLFLIGEETSVEELKTQLKKEKKEIDDAVALLVERGVIESIASGDVEEMEEKSTEKAFVEDIVSEEISEDLQEMALEDSSLEEKPVEEEEPEDIPVELPEVNTDDSEEESMEQESPGDEEDVSFKTEAETTETDLSLDETVEEQQISEEVLEEEDGVDLGEREDDEDSIDLDFDEPQEKMGDISGSGDKESAEMTNLIEELDEMGDETAKTDTYGASKDAKEKDKKVAGGKTIMVIDDSIVIRKMVEIALEEDDFRIVTATSGKEGMTVLDAESPDLVILDMMLPDMNGIDVLKTIKASKGIPVIMLSGKDSPQLIETAKGVGADDFLPKPFRDEELVEKVKNLLK
jgi:CheY-like chemotaxis protein